MSPSMWLRDGHVDAERGISNDRVNTDTGLLSEIADDSLPALREGKADSRGNLRGRQVYYAGEPPPQPTQRTTEGDQERGRDIRQARDADSDR